MRYKANCRISDYTVIYTDEKAWNNLRLYLMTCEQLQFENLIFTDNETKMFYLKPEVYVNSYSGPGGNYYVNGKGAFPQIQLAMTIANGDVEISVKPFSYSPNDISWKVKGDTAYDYKLENNLCNSQWNNYLNPRFIENYFRKNITVEEVED